MSESKVISENYFVLIITASMRPANYIIKCSQWSTKSVD